MKNMNDEEYYRELIQELRYGDINDKYNLNLNYHDQVVVLRFIDNVLLPKVAKEPKKMKSKSKSKRRHK